MMKAKNVKECIAIIIADRDYKILWVNEDFITISGYSLAEVHGKKPSILKGRNTEKSAVGRISRHLEMEEPFQDRIITYRKNGEEYICVLSVHPVFNSGNELMNFVALAIDGDCADAATVSLLRVHEKYMTSNLKESDELRIYFALQDYFRDRKPYLDANLSQNEVAKEIGTNEKYLSQVINRQTGKNFRRFVNRYRVHEFEVLVANQEMSKLTLFGIAEKCGFKSKSTFHKAVVEHVGCTPKAIAARYILEGND